MTQSLLDIRDLEVSFRGQAGRTKVVKQLSLQVYAGETVALVGESGSGKTVTARSILRLLPPSAHIDGGSINFAGRDLLALTDAELRAVRGDHISMVFQEPMRSLNPLHRVGDQVAEVLRLHRGMSRSQAREEAVRLFGLAGIADAELRARQYPHSLSGGMRQRVMIAMALGCEPRLLIADEPTTALDVTVEAQVLDLIRRRTAESGTGVLLITHDLGIVADLADRVLVMYKGEIVESGPTSQLLDAPSHEYTRGLLAALPSRSERGQRLAPDAAAPRRVVTREPIDHAADISPVTPLLQARDLTKVFPAERKLFGGKSGHVQALRGVSFDIFHGTTLGLVGESGSGKSTTGRLVTRLLDVSSGTVSFDGKDITHLAGAELRQARADFHIVFQDPYSSLDPRRRVRDAIAEPIVAHRRMTRADRAQRVDELLGLVGLPAAFADRLPHELSGGQRQRIAIARALAAEPRLIVCDEPVSSLDVSTQAQVANLLQDLQEQLGLTYLFIAHDLALVHHLSDRIAVMYLGRIVEEGPAEAVYRSPAHPYTRCLVASIPGTRRNRDAEIAVEGEPPSAVRMGAGCSFASRCPFVQEICRVEDPPLRPLGSGVSAACHFAEQLPEHRTIAVYSEAAPQAARS